MSRLHLTTLRRAPRNLTLRRGLCNLVAVAGIVAITVLAMRWFGPRQTAAHPAQLGPLQASEFVLVGPDEATRASLGVREDGSVGLRLYSSAGTLTTTFEQDGMGVYDPNTGTHRLGIGINAEGDPGLNVADSDGKQLLSLGVGEGPAGTRAVYSIFNPDGSRRLSLGVVPGREAIIVINDAQGNPVLTLP